MKKVSLRFAVLWYNVGALYYQIIHTSKMLDVLSLLLYNEHTFYILDNLLV